MTASPQAVIDLFGRRVDEIFSESDQRRLRDTVQVVWARDEPMPDDQAAEALETAEFVVCSGWRYGELRGRFPRLRAIIDVAGGLPRGLDYEEAYARGIHVLTAAPGFGRQDASARPSDISATCRPNPGAAVSTWMPRA